MGARERLEVFFRILLCPESYLLTRILRLKICTPTFTVLVVLLSMLSNHDVLSLVLWCCFNQRCCNACWKNHLRRKPAETTGHQAQKDSSTLWTISTCLRYLCLYGVLSSSPLPRYPRCSRRALLLQHCASHSLLLFRVAFCVSELAGIHVLFSVLTELNSEDKDKIAM